MHSCRSLAKHDLEGLVEERLYGNVPYEVRVGAYGKRGHRIRPPLPMHYGRSTQLAVP